MLAPVFGHSGGYTMRRILTSLAALAAFAGAASAQISDTAIYGSVKVADLENLVTAMGHEYVKSGLYGDVSVQGRVTASGLNFHLIGTACDQPNVDGCLGIWMLVHYDADGTESLTRINEANWKWIPTTTFYSADGIQGKPSVGVSRYLILDGGVTWRNLKDNILNFLEIVPQSANYVWQAGEYAPGYDEDW